MLANLLLGVAVMAICLMLQALLVAAAMRYYVRHRYLLHSTTLGSSLALIAGVMFLLVGGNLLQIAIWAALFQMLGEFSGFGDSFYHSAVNFATLGYGDIVMSAERRLLGPLEAVNGVLMIGVSTAALMTAFEDVFRKTMAARVAGGNDPSDL